MIKGAVLGSPIKHSLSPSLHKRGFEFLGIKGDYTAIDLNAEQLRDFLLGDGMAYDYLSLTMPLKEVAIELCNQRSADVEVLGALNTLVKRDQGWSGFNTDVLGFEYLLSNVPHGEVAILGAGGTARAALLASSRLGFSPTIYRRNPERDKNLVRIASDVEIREWSEIPSAFTAHCLINATPAGALALSEVIASSYVIDALYHPWPTEISRWVKPETVFSTGLELLAAQAMYQLQLITMRPFDLDQIFTALLSEAHSHINK